FGIVTAKKHQPDFLECLVVEQKLLDRSRRHDGRFADRITVNAGRDRREGYGLKTVLHHETQRVRVARGEQFRFVLTATPIYRTDAMNHMLGWHFSCGGNNGFSCAGGAVKTAPGRFFL